MALTNKKIANSYKDLLQVDNSNNGLNATKTIKDGAGVSSCAAISNNQLLISPASNSLNTFNVANATGDSLLRVSGTLGRVDVGTTLSTVNTQYLRFMAKDIDVDNGTHYGVPLLGFYTSGSAEMPNTEITFGTSANPSVPTFSTNSADDMIHYLHYVDTNITVDAVQVLVAASGSSGDSLNFHLVSLATSDSTTVNDFSSCTVVADDSGTSSDGYEQFYRVALDVDSSNADVDAGKYLALTIEGDGTNSDYSVNALVRYHLR